MGVGKFLFCSLILLYIYMCLFPKLMTLSFLFKRTLVYSAVTFSFLCLHTLLISLPSFCSSFDHILPVVIHIQNNLLIWREKFGNFNSVLIPQYRLFFSRTFVYISLIYPVHLQTLWCQVNLHWKLWLTPNQKVISHIL